MLDQLKKRGRLLTNRRSLCVINHILFCAVFRDLWALPFAPLWYRLGSPLFSWRDFNSFARRSLKKIWKATLFAFFRQFRGEKQKVVFDDEVPPARGRKIPVFGL